MKNSLLAPLFIFVMVACQSQKVYYYTETTRSQAFGEKVSDPEVIKAKDDTTAFAEAYQKFQFRVLTYNDLLKKNPDLNVISLPINFELTDREGKVIYFEEIVRRYDDVLDHNSSVPDNNKAYAGAEFGMTMDEVLSIDHFKNLRLQRYGDSLCGWDIVGNKSYLMTLSFYKGALYEVVFESDSDYNRYYDPVREKTENLRDVFMKAYGSPSYAFGIPMENEFAYGTSRNLYRWPSKNKDVEINYARSTGGKHRMWASIVDRARNEAKEREQEERARQAEIEKDKRINDAARAF